MRERIIPPAKLMYVRSILVIRFRFMGDMVVSTPLFSNLRTHFPQAHIAAFTDDIYQDALRYHPAIDELIAFPRLETRSGNFQMRAREWRKLLRLLRSRHFDLVIDLAKGRTSSILARLTGAPLRIGYFKESAPHWYTRLYNYPMRDGEDDGLHCRDHYLQPLQILGLPVVDYDLILPPRPEEERAVEVLMERHGLPRDGFIMLHPGARHPRKRWPAEYWARLMDELHATSEMPLVIIGGGDESELSQGVLRHAHSPAINLVGALSVGELAALGARSRLFIGNDSGPMHVVSTSGVKIVCLFGPTDDRVWKPVGNGHCVVRRDCSCGLGGPVSACDTEGARCMRNIAPEAVLAAAQKLL